MLGRSTVSGCDVSFLCKKIKKEEGPAWASPVATPMPKSVFSERRDRLLRGRMCCVCLRMRMRTFHRWGDLIFIVDVLPVRW